jgi:hypothetical protein
VVGIEAKIDEIYHKLMILGMKLTLSFNFEGRSDSCALREDLSALVRFSVDSASRMGL